MDLHKRSQRPDNASIRYSGQGGCEPAAPCATGRAPHRARIRERLDALAGHEPRVRVNGLRAGYGPAEILHGVDLCLGAGQLLCLVGPTGAGKSTLLHAIYGLADIRAGRVEVGGRNVTRLGPNAKLREAGVACVLQDSSMFPDVTVEQNLWLGGHLLSHRDDARHATERVFGRYPVLAAKRDEPARNLSGGERRLLEISRALVMRPRVLLVDEPSLGLESASVDMIFATLRDLRDRDRLSIVVVERNARKGLAAADIGCVIVEGEIARVGTGSELLNDPNVNRFFPGAEVRFSARCG